MATWQAARPDGRLVLLEGEAGIGKTRLAEAAAVAIRASGGIVLATRGYPGEGTIAYAPIAELLRAGLALPDAATRLAGLDDVARLEIGRLVELPTAAARRVAGRPSPTRQAPASACLTRSRAPLRLSRPARRRALSGWTICTSPTRRHSRPSPTWLDGWPDVRSLCSSRPGVRIWDDGGRDRG